jgi:hypothetical protein
MTSRQLIAWQARHAHRARSWWSSPLVVTAVLGGVIATWVATRGLEAQASHGWLLAAILVFAVAFLRVPFLIYWRSDAAVLAQLPIEGRALFDASAWRCASAAAVCTVAVAIGAVPFALHDTGALLRHLAVAGALGASAAGLLPAVATWGATLVATSDGMNRGGMRIAAALATASPTGAARAASSDTPPAPSALLGALPGFAATVVIVLVLLDTRWLAGTGAPAAQPALVFGGLAAGSLVAWLVARAFGPAHMGTILRDVSALDRQRLAVLEIRPPTAIERGVAGAIGAAARLVYLKDVRLMRRRYPMAFALGALAFLVLIIVGFARPAAATSWLVAVIGGATLYAAILGERLRVPPIELPRLSATLPIAPSAAARAKLAWVAAWWLIFVGVPAAFAVVRTSI